MTPAEGIKEAELGKHIEAFDIVVTFKPGDTKVQHEAKLIPETNAGLTEDLHFQIELIPQFEGADLAVQEFKLGQFPVQTFKIEAVSPVE